MREQRQMELGDDARLHPPHVRVLTFQPVAKLYLEKQLLGCMGEGDWQQQRERYKT